MNAPFLELNYYYQELDDATSLYRLTADLVSRGAKLTGTGFIDEYVPWLACFGPSNPGEATPIPIKTIEDLRAFSSKKDAAVITLDLIGGTSLDSDEIETVSFVEISERAATVDHHPVSLMTSGDWCESYFDPFIDRNRSVKLFNRFRSIALATAPAYASLTMEYGMECPTDLASNPNSEAFIDCFINTNSVSLPAELVAKLTEVAYTEQSADGFLISMSGLFNPLNRQVPYELSRQYSYEIGKACARLASR